MSKKDYIALAEALLKARARFKAPDAPGIAYETAEQMLTLVAEEIASVCARDNGRFDRDRFLRAALQGEFYKARGHNNRARRTA